jgi:hypothetical protein
VSVCQLIIVVVVVDIEKPIGYYSTDVYVNEGDAAIIPVPSIQSFPKATFEWYANDALIVPNQKFSIETNTNNLIILNAQKSDEKSYYVKAYNVHTGKLFSANGLKIHASTEPVFLLALLFCP